LPSAIAPVLEQPAETREMLKVWSMTGFRWWARRLRHFGLGAQEEPANPLFSAKVFLPQPFTSRQCHHWHLALLLTATL